MIYPCIYNYTYCTSCSLFKVAGNAIILSTQLPWFSLAKSMAEKGHQIINWPERVPFAGETRQGQKKSGTKTLSTVALTCLYKAFVTQRPHLALFLLTKQVCSLLLLARYVAKIKNQYFFTAMLEGKMAVLVGVTPPPDTYSCCTYAEFSAHGISSSFCYTYSHWTFHVNSSTFVSNIAPLFLKSICSLSSQTFHSCLFFRILF